MSEWLESLAKKFPLKTNEKKLTKMDILLFSKKYLEFLHLMDNNETFFEEYSKYENLRQAFHIFLFNSNLYTLNHISNFDLSAF